MFIDSPKEYIFNLFGAMDNTLRAIVGWRIAEVQRLPVDGKYAEISYDTLHAAIEHSYAKMRSDGWTEWKKDSRDCDDFAMMLKSLVVDFILDNEVLNDAVPVWLFFYTKTNGQHHVNLKVQVDGRTVYFEVYPWVAIEPMKLTEKEILSAALIL